MAAIVFILLFLRNLVSVEPLRRLHLTGLSGVKSASSAKGPRRRVGCRHDTTVSLALELAVLGDDLEVRFSLRVERFLLEE